MRNSNLFWILVLIFMLAPLVGEATELDQDDLLDMSLEELLDIKIESASKKEEKIFDAPLTSTVITKEQIFYSGVLTIPEALRLAPGLIVREQTPGNYDIHVRGLDNLPPNLFLSDFTNTTILVMVDYRVVYSYFQGGTFWETLGIGLNDVERIEIIVGPAAAMYGPNAVTGVINIITRKQVIKGAFTRGSVQYDVMNYKRIINETAGYKTGDLAISLSSNYTHMDRYQTEYYSFALGKYVSTPEELPKTLTPENMLDDPMIRYPDRKLALDEFGVNAFVNYHRDKNLTLDLGVGYQNSSAQKVVADTLATSLTTNTSESYYADLRSKFLGFTTQLSFAKGSKETPTGNLVAHPNTNEMVTEYLFDFQKLDFQLDYDFSHDTLSIRPGISYRYIEYEGLAISSRNPDNSVYDPSKSIHNLAASLLTEYTFFSRLRVIGSLRLDYFPGRTEHEYYPITLESDIQQGASTDPVTKAGQSSYLSYQLALTYNINTKNMLRAVYGRAYRAPFLVPSFLHDVNPPITVRGNRALELLVSDSAEIGYRGKITENLEVDLVVFGSYTRDFTTTYLHLADPLHGKLVYQFDLLDIYANQYGATLSLVYYKKSFSARVFGTIQETKIYNFMPDLLHFFDFTIDAHDVSKQVDYTHKATPALYGGAWINYRPFSSLNINLNIYYYTQHNMIRTDVVIGMMNQAKYNPAVFNVNGSVLCNAKISYEMQKGIYGFINLRNIFNVGQQEFAWGDRKQAVYMVGMSFDWDRY